MRNPVLTASVVIGLALGVAACTAQSVESGVTAQADPDVHSASHPLPAAGFIRRGDSFATMAEQYTPRAGPYAATGASAWVRPAPPPAFVASGPPPPADPPAPPPAAVANRQPSPAPAPPASEVARPEAAAPDASAAAAPNPALRTAGLALFNSYSCSACHVLADAGAAGSIGPSLDRNPGLTRAHTINVITNGQGAMPAFAGQISDAEIAALADYIVAFSRK